MVKNKTKTEKSKSEKTIDPTSSARESVAMAIQKSADRAETEIQQNNYAGAAALAQICSTFAGALEKLD